jgi:hypothetical protein
MWRSAEKRQEGLAEFYFDFFRQTGFFGFGLNDAPPRSFDKKSGGRSFSLIPESCSVSAICWSDAPADISLIPIAMACFRALVNGSGFELGRLAG